MSKLNDIGNPDRRELLGESVCAGEEASVVPQEAGMEPDDEHTDIAANENAAEITNTRLANQSPENPQTESLLVESSVSEWEEEPLTGSTEASIKNASEST